MKRCNSKVFSLMLVLCFESDQQGRREGGGRWDIMSRARALRGARLCRTSQYQFRVNMLPQCSNIEMLKPLFVPTKYIFYLSVCFSPFLEY